MSHKEFLQWNTKFGNTLASGTRERHDSCQHQCDKYENSSELHGENAPSYVSCEKELCMPVLTKVEK